MSWQGEDKKEETTLDKIKEDPVQLSIFSHRFMGIAEQMGRTLQRTAISVNMKVSFEFVLKLKYFILPTSVSF